MLCQLTYFCANQGLKTGFLGVNIPGKKVTLWDEGKAPFSATTLPDIGKALVQVLKPENYEKTANRYLYVESYTITQLQLKGVLEKVSGASWTAETLDSRAVEKESAEKLKNGDFSAIPKLIGGVSYGYRRLGDFSSYGLANDEIGLPRGDIEADVKAVLDSV